ncbi:3-methyladenine DNA glycosylase [Phycicoccus sp. CSK15P-2]|uniref:3-methyladenine DNA glycosylase n=1 Tax=Phycicoccus sp. CSK15P-2 TaxID=2807627 RepID=UPI00194EA480|nr:3-methyladenine DNA glycosylase [Phycicoccus sp. CSK15P-2]MBM6405618.1 3-methyladenine DNA glycosylase [Phycicoccus sp. CSK15P-2]
MPSTTTTVLPSAEWAARAEAHAARVDAATWGHRTRRTDGRSHPVEDFLFRYYNHSPAKLRRWHPGPWVALEGAAATERATWRHHRVVGDAVVLDTASFLEARGDTVRFVRELLTATLSRPPHLGCLGLHEWAMVHRLPEDDVRHPGWPLRLGPAGTDEVLDRHTVRCTHADAYRFFTASAAPRNTFTPTRERQVELEQPGCLHAGMDVYKWAFKLAPLVPSEVTADAFELARDIRVLDMQASPYDLRELGYDPVRIETPEGKAEYLARQRAFVGRSNGLRRHLLDVLDTVVAAGR